MPLMDRRVSVPLFPLLTMLLVVLAVGAVAWVRDADVRRVEGACETWLIHRDGLDAVVDETREALERLDDAGSRRPDTLSAAYNDADRERGALEGWVAVAPGLREDIGDWHADASQALKHSLSSSRQLLGAIRTDAATDTARADADLAASNLEATQRWLRDTCGNAWRG